MCHDDMFDARIGELLLCRGWRLATAESCTGGLVAHLVTLRAGSSRYFLGGVVSYTNEVKHTVLGVPLEVIAAAGVVSEAVAIRMADGVCSLLGSDVGIATTGIAGPTGATSALPVGSVWVAARTPQASLAELCHFAGDRQAVVEAAARAALDLAARLIGDHHDRARVDKA